MKLNENTVVVGKNVLLVPYERYHVPKYHEWMKSEELQRLTASEPLTLEEEYNMQHTWRLDEQKCTYIVLDKGCYDTRNEQGSQEQQEIDSMVGDVNFFLDETGEVAEAEIMIAESKARGQGLGKEALCSMLRYGMEVLGVKKFEAKVGFDNQPSLNLFCRLGFTEMSRSDVFQEITMQVSATEQFKHLVQSWTSHYKIQSHRPSSEAMQ